MKEVWRDIAGYEGYYKISNLGNIKSLVREVNAGIRHSKTVIKKGRILKSGYTMDGYDTVCLSKNNIRKTYRVARLVGGHFVDNPENKPQINHIDGDKHNNGGINLEWVTAKENTSHAYQSGLINSSAVTKRLEPYFNTRKRGQDGRYY